jgi:hypothetical protein
MRLLINFFIIIHLFLIIIWLFPVNKQFLDLLRFFRGYIIFIGLDQDYSMFAPDPRKINRHLFALITFQDQSTVIYPYPQMERLAPLSAMQKERYRKFGNDNIVAPCFKMFLPDFARYIARQSICRNNQPELISIYQVDRQIPEPQQTTYIKTEQPQVFFTNLFSYQVKKGDL